MVTASPASLIRAQPLLAAPDSLAAVVMPLAAHARVEVLERQGGWSRVRAGDKKGWLRVLALRETRSALPTTDNVAELFRADSTDNKRIVAVAGLRGLPLPRPSSHALILTISAYSNGIPPLLGVALDTDSAALMARALGVPETNTTVLEDALTLDKMRTALDGLEARVMPNDEVFLYYSGHGTRLKVFEGRTARCAEALITADAQVFMDEELQYRLQRIATKARRLVVFLDASFIGTTTHTLGSAKLTGKFWAKTGSETCEHPTNVLMHGLRDAKPGEGKLNFIYITAARDDEMALDNGERGGLATLAWLDCLSGAVRDSDRSGGISAAELAACAQPKIERQAAASRLGAQHLTLTGNDGMVLVAPIDLLAGAAAASPVASVAETSTVAVLRDIHANRDDRRTVRLTADKAAYKIKQDRVSFSLTSSHDGYVYLLMVGSDNRSFDLLFPNKKDERNYIRAGETWQLPRAGWSIRAGGPVGLDHLLAMVSDTPRDFAAIGMNPVGPFSVLTASLARARDMQFVSATSAHAAKLDCGKTGAQRTLEIVATCSDAYGTDLISLEEVEK
jgi:hypothetical protein